MRGDNGPPMGAYTWAELAKMDKEPSKAYPVSVGPLLSEPARFEVRCKKLG